MPFWRMVDPSRIGLAGHSFGAQGSSWIGQLDDRVDAVVAWDALCDPTVPPTSYADTLPFLTSSGVGGQQGCLVGGLGDPRLRVPALSITADYFLTPAPYLTTPDPEIKGAASRNYSNAGIDTGAIVIRGGTHYEWSYLSMEPFGATLRGMHLSAWYTTAWFDRYVKGDKTATDRLLTQRWRHDATEAAVDPTRDGNMFSYHFRSRLDIGHRGGARVTCETSATGAPHWSRTTATPAGTTPSRSPPPPTTDQLGPRPRCPSGRAQVLPSAHDEPTLLASRSRRQPGVRALDGQVGAAVSSTPGYGRPCR